MKIYTSTNKQINKLLKHHKLGYLIIGILVYSTMASQVLAVSPTPKNSPTPSVKPSQNQLPVDNAALEKIQKIKDIVASKVAELNLVEKRGIVGSIKEINGMKITITDVKGDTRQIDVDELTKFNLEDKDAGISDLTKGSTYSFIGIYNKETQRLLCRNIDTANTIPVYFEGAISELNEDDFQISIVNAKGEKKSVDIQGSTKTRLADNNGELIKSGFSKLEINSRVLAIGFLDKKDKNLISALRVIHFADVPPSKEMQSHVSPPVE